MMRCLCNICNKPCKEISMFCSDECKDKYEIKYAKLIEWDKQNPHPTYKQCDERQRIVEECKRLKV